MPEKLRIIPAVIILFAAAAAAPATGAEAPGGRRMISINLPEEVDLRVFLDYVSKRTGKTFLFDEKFRNVRVTLLAPVSIPEENLFSLLEAMLEYEGWALEPAGDNLIKVRQAGEAGRKPMPLYLPEDLPDLPETDKMITLAYKVRYVGVPELQPVVAQLGSQGAVVAIARSNVLIMTDYARNLKRLVKVIRMVDDPSNVPELKIVQLEYASAENLGKQLQRALQAEAKILGAPGPQQPTVEFDIPTNTLILVATPSDIRKIEALIERLDVPPLAGGRNFQIYRLNNAKAGDVAETLQALIQEGPSGVRQVPGARGRPSVEPSAAGVLGAADVRVIGDEGQNAVIVVAPPEVQSEIQFLIEQLDRRKPQVLIEALVVQVSGGSDLDIGVELAAFGEDALGVTNFDFSQFDFETGQRTIKEGLGLTHAIIDDEDIPFVLRVLLVENQGRVISRPRILANDNAEATFESLDEEPTTSINTVTSTTATTSFGGFQSAGTRLVITPHISDTGYLSLEITFEVSQFTGESTSTEVPPARRRDSVVTDITVPDRSTIVIGGLSGYHSSDVVSKVPILGDIPLLGALFRRTRTIWDDTTEYVFIKGQIARHEAFEDLLDLSGRAQKESRKLEARMRERARAMLNRTDEEYAEEGREELDEIVIPEEE